MYEETKDKLTASSERIDVELKRIQQCAAECATHVTESNKDQEMTLSEFMNQRTAATHELQFHSESLCAHLHDSLKGFESDMTIQGDGWNKKLTECQTKLDATRDEVQKTVDFIGNSVVEQLDEQMETVLPTGKTPRRKFFHYPSHLTLTESHDKLLQKFTINEQLLEDLESDDMESDIEMASNCDNFNYACQILDKVKQPMLSASDDWSFEKENEQSPAELTKLQYKQKIKVPLTVAMNCKK
ncbi:uncharacterized protein LOC134177359 [Corticium candelabrum]|uniref:uncharacterized protein LOC134177359 n=1 Tax=Corticium candelabrum TaxID=121492 RepID=UPI002E253B3F|nr:uncharacterized protein LOC134177359 [Corticium candelabrum]